MTLNTLEEKLTTFSLVLDTGDCSLFPPINRGWKIVGLLMQETAGPSPATSEHPVVANL